MPPTSPPSAGSAASARPVRIAARTAQLEGLGIRRALPTREQRMVGAWCFLDHIGPVEFAPGQGMHVGAHPHTGLQTFTWMIEGEILHRDSLGSAQVLRPGEVNLMTAGHGIAHTEDSLPSSARLHAAQLWIALPPGQADCAPAFEHYPQLPAWHEQGCTLTLLAGSCAGRTAPVRVYSPLLGLDIASAQGGRLHLPLDPAFEHGLLPLEGSMQAAQDHFGPGEFAYFAPGATQLALELAPGSRILLLGGVPLAAPPLLWWNFVGATRADVDRARQDWESGSARFGAVEGGGHRRIPAPGWDGARPVAPRAG